MDIGTQLNLMEYLRDYIDNRANQDAVIPSNVGVNDVSLSALINKYNEMILERNRLLRTSSESNPVIIRKTAISAPCVPTSGRPSTVSIKVC